MPAAAPPASPFGLVKITDEEFQDIRRLVYQHFGINLTEQKRSLVVGRLQKYLRLKGFDTFKQFYNFVTQDKSGKALGELINRISTNHTFFFREKDHFDFFTTSLLPELESRLTKHHSKDIRIWCAGCSYGDEPYSIAITMMEYFGNRYHQWDAGLLATDISQTVLEVAKAGIYPEERLSLVPPQLKQKYFRPLPDGSWQVSDILKNEIVFRRLNLINPQLPFKKQFHLISCRNVMIYFDQPTRQALVNRFYNLTAPNGYLFIGHSETLRGENCPYEYIQPAIYRKGIHS